MKLSEYLLDKKIYFIVHTLSLTLLMILLQVLSINRSGQIFVLIFMSFSHGLYLLHDYYRRYRFYHNIKEHLSGLDKKHYISTFIQKPNFYEGALLEEVVSESCKSMNDEISIHKQNWNEYQDYIEQWVHEVKTPLAASFLILENNHNPMTQNVNEELKKVERYVEQALYFARSSHLEKDYVIRTIKLDDVIKSSVKLLSKLLIGKDTELKIDANVSVKTDSKWLEFILTQIISNSIKYSDSPLKLSFKTTITRQQVILSIIDNGYGIKSEEISKIFDKGYVGTTGRLSTESTGIGLYLCKKLCHKMSLDINVLSQVNMGTEVKIFFPLSDYYNQQ